MALSSRALPQVPEHLPRHRSRREVSEAPDRYSRCPWPPPPPPASCRVGDSPAGQVGATGGSRLWGRLQLPQGWADTGALHTAGGDTSPRHNSWQPGQRRPPSCRRRSRRSRHRRRRRRSSCRLCRCSSCYCGEGGSSAAAGSVRGAGSGGVGNQREPMHGHLHLQPLRMSPCPRLYSGRGTQRPAARRGHDSGRSGEGSGTHGSARRSRSPGPARAALVCIHTTRAPARPITGAPGWARTGRQGQREGSAGRRGAVRLPGSEPRAAKFLQLRPRREGHPAGGPREGPAADWSEV